MLAKRSLKRCVRWVATALVFTHFFCARFAWAEFGPTDTSPWRGSARFVSIAQEELGARAIVTRRINYSELRIEDAVVFVHPTRSFELGSLERWISAGGRAIIYDDFGTANELYTDYRIERVPLPKKPVLTLRGDPVFSVAEPAGSHETVTDVERVVTNHATGVKHPSLSPVLKVRGDQNEDVMFALAGMVGKGRLLAVGDSSLALNAMLRFPGNETFVRNVFRYAASDDTWGARGGNVYLVFEEFEQEGAFGEEPGIASTLRGITRAMGDFRRKVASEGFPAWFLFATAIAVSFGAVGWVANNAAKRHRKLIPRYVRPVPVSLQGGVAGHAELLVAPKTPRSLALLEIKAAFDETCAELFSLDSLPGVDLILRRVRDESLLPESLQKELSMLLHGFAEVETAVLAKRSPKVTDAEVVEKANRALFFLQEMTRAMKKGTTEAAP